MLTIGFILLIVDTIITVAIMNSVMNLLCGVRPEFMRIFLLKIMNHPITAFLTNLTISSILSYFTGEGMIAGMANLLSSVLVGVFLPRYTSQKYARFMIPTPKKTKEQKEKLVIE